ncbi:MAG: hypothetical protein H0W75_05850 [Chitinophagaceae bacterium]|nr:hypothetical protein [Chitinophagaceae bacterium]
MTKYLNTRIDSLKILTSALLNYAETFSFVIRKDGSYSQSIKFLLIELEKYLVDYRSVSEWPGTKLLWEEDKAVLYTYYLNNETAFILYNYEDYLFNWIHPASPEDLVFYKNDKAFFISITHEQDAYFELDDNGEYFLKNKRLI